MPAFLQGKRISRMGALTEPSTYDADLTPVDMQLGKTAYVQGEKITGTGKCFEFAEYGQSSIYPIFDENYNMKYGFLIEVGNGANVVFLSSTTDGDIVVQDVFTVNETKEGEAVKIGENKTTLTDINAFHLDGFLVIYCVDIADENTSLNFFVGKDNTI